MSKPIPMPRRRMYEFWNAAKDSIADNITKIVMYSDTMPESVPAWKRSINRSINRLRIFNVSEKGVHFTKAKLLRDFAYEFLSGLPQSICDEAWETGYPAVQVTDKDIKSMLQVLDDFCDQVLTPGGKLP